MPSENRGGSGLRELCCNSKEVGDMGELKIKEREVLRYLGHKKGMDIPANIKELLEEAKRLVLQHAVPKVAKGVFDIAVADEGVQVLNTNLTLPGVQLANLLQTSRRAVLMAVTLGSGVDRLIQRTEKRDLALALVLDATATALVEEVCDRENEAVTNAAKAQNCYTTPRFSPGYGDLPLDVQPQLLEALMAGRVAGITCNDEFLLTPRKSVTAIIGIGKTPHGKKGGCENCNLRDDCPYNKGEEKTLEL